MSRVSSQKRANEKQNKDRKGVRVFSTVRFRDSAKLAEINNVIELSGCTREVALINAFAAYRKELESGQ